MARQHLTAQGVERMKAPASGQLDIIDAGYPGLALRVSYGGRKAWQYLYRWDGKAKRLALGTYPEVTLADARDAWRAARDAIKEGRDPATVPTVVAQDSDAFSAVLADWLARDQKTNRSCAEVKRIVEKETKAWRNLPITAITKRMATDLIDDVADRRSPRSSADGAVTMARRTHAHLHRLFRWCKGRGIIEQNPLADVPKPGSETKRKRALSDTELALAWHAASEMGWPTGDAIKLLILTLGRRDEIGDLRWDEVDLEENQIHLREEDGRCKNGVDHIVPLSSAARAIIDTLPRVLDSDFVFTTTGKSPINSWSNTKEQLDRLMLEHAKAQAAKRGDDPTKVAIKPWRFHDLRRTGATGLERLGFPLPVTEAVLGHISGSKGGITGVYQIHDYAAEKRAALEAWAEHVEKVVATLQRPTNRLAA